jgi:hypothetical protein
MKTVVAYVMAYAIYLVSSHHVVTVLKLLT